MGYSEVNRRMVNFGCGITPTKDFINCDNSPALFLAKLPKFIINLLFKLKIISQENLNYIIFSKKENIRYIDIRKKLPFQDDSVDLVYSSHVLEHLYRKDAEKFLIEAKRILKKDGYIRLVLPDLRKLIHDYNLFGDADSFMNNSLLGENGSDTFYNRLFGFFIGARKHQWMYDELSLTKLIKNLGFVNVSSQKIHESSIPYSTNLNFAEGGEGSIFIEAQSSK